MDRARFALTCDGDGHKGSLRGPLHTTKPTNLLHNRAYVVRTGVATGEKVGHDVTRRSLR